jgi:hypothetical protein
VHENARRSKAEPAYELADTGAFDDNRYFDVVAEFAKGGPDDLLVRLTIANRGPNAATLHVLPTLWLRNTWSWGRRGEKYGPKPSLTLSGVHIAAHHWSLGNYELRADSASNGAEPTWLFTENDTTSSNCSVRLTRSRM